ncbi:hypothetical protein J40TS1_50980 [Paenibacillus montaniterrae]|uniref:Glycoside hydrolase n=1 Tax=Paenibacillus montaniterrae TaxID=429341 RepID=A0A919YVT7_9BACL|nr:hypothetical protein [Paenibacillus montaniterrae]GIP19456.1 hypothetical protein J40TS1_50980 [Paenibacillus montaniterrae]
MLYSAKAFDPQLFKQPTSAYRGAPFWAWNTKLSKELLLEQLEQFPAMGMGGFHIHARVGLDTPYLGDEFMEMVKLCADEAERQQLLCWLYDEDRWPSGYGGGIVTKDEAYRSRYLVITPFKADPNSGKTPSFDSCAAVVSHGRGQLLAAFRIVLDEQNLLKHYVMCEHDAQAAEGETIWYVYLEVAGDSPWFNNEAYVDTLNPAAVRKFIEVTHERYAEAVGEHFGATIPAMFTDEPQFPHKQFLGYARSQSEIILPFTDDFEQTYRERYGSSLLEHLPELLWEGRTISVARYRYHQHLAERFAEAFADQIGRWCEEHGLMLAGHMMEEPTLHSQTRALGEVMRSLSSFGLPGIDMLCDQREYTTAKQAQSVVHQYNRPGVLSELYGVTNWDFDFRGHKLQGDWMAALGVTVRVHHLTWLSMGGEAKRDYPASIGLQSPWYKEYPLIEDHFARLNTVLTLGKPLVRIGVIHPVESYWLYFGPNDQTSLIREQLEAQFSQVTDWLLFGLQDFDYISEALIPAQQQGTQLGHMSYDVIVVPGCHTLRQSTLDFLAKFAAAGKQVVMLGELPRFIDAKPWFQIEQWDPFTVIPFTKQALLEALEPYRLVDMHYDGPKFLKKPRHKKNWDGERTQKFLYQMREEGSSRWLFIANGRAEQNKDVIEPDDVTITVAGSWQAELMDTFTGEIHQLAARHGQGTTSIYHRFYNHDSLLLHLVPAEKAQNVQALPPLKAERGSKASWERHLHDAEVCVKREEDNVLLLDLAEYKLDDEPWQEREEILRIDNICRAKLGYPPRRAALAQPWVEQNEQQESEHILLLRFTFSAETSFKGTRLALEHGTEIDICLNGQWLHKQEAGSYVDSCLTAYLLPTLQQGSNELLLRLPYSRRLNVEAAFLLGDFDVAIHGSRCSLKLPTDQISFSSLTSLGMPFYGGNAVYSTKLALEPGQYELQVSKYRAPLLDVAINGQQAGQIAFAPYSVTFTVAETDGDTLIEIRSYGSRVNTFGAVHNCDEQEVYFDPNAWRTERDEWSYEYQLKQTGILKAPVMRKLTDEAYKS